MKAVYIHTYVRMYLCIEWLFGAVMRNYNTFVITVGTTSLSLSINYSMICVLDHVHVVYVCVCC